MKIARRSPLRVVSMGYDAVSGFHASEPYVVIGIATPGDTHAPLREDPNRIAVLHLAFDDVTVRRPSDLARYHALDVVPYNLRIAAGVVRFVERHLPYIALCVVHCEAGISRSVAMADALTRLYGRGMGTHSLNGLVFWLTLLAGRDRAA